MKLYFSSILFATFIVSIHAMDNGWFEGTGPFKKANELLKAGRYAEAAKEYETVQLQLQHELQMGQINGASASMATGYVGRGFASFGRETVHESPIKGGRWLSEDAIERYGKDEVVFAVTTERLGFGDIANFLQAVVKLAAMSRVPVQLFVPGLLVNVLYRANNTFTVHSNGNAPVLPERYYKHNLMGVLELMKIELGDMIPEKALLTGEEKTNHLVAEELFAQLVDKDGLCGLLPGDNRVAIVMGGKSLKSRNFNMQAFQPILDENPNILFIDLNGSNNMIRFDDNPKEADDQAHLVLPFRYKQSFIRLLNGNGAFTAEVALARCMTYLKKEGSKKKAGCIVADNGPSHFILQGLDKQDQNMVAYIIPHAHSRDMRNVDASGQEREVYPHSMYNCNVYFTGKDEASLEDQTHILTRAFNDLIKGANA